MLARGLIRSSNSPWSSPIVLAPKKDATYRFCVNFLRVNSVTKKDVLPMPRVDDILDQLGGSRWYPGPCFRVLAGTLEGGRYREYCLLNWFRPLRIQSYTFGLTNAPVTFQRMMGKILKGLQGCLVFLDDIIIFSETWERHQRILEEVLQRIRAAYLHGSQSNSLVTLYPSVVTSQILQKFKSCVTFQLRPAFVTSVGSLLWRRINAGRFIENFCAIARVD